MTERTNLGKTVFQVYGSCVLIATLTVAIKWTLMFPFVLMTIFAGIISQSQKMSRVEKNPREFVFYH